MGILKEMTQVINDNGGTIHDTRATSLGGLFSLTTEVAVKEDSAAMSFALQSALNDYHVVVRPETEMEPTEICVSHRHIKKNVFETEILGVRDEN